MQHEFCRPAFNDSRGHQMERAPYLRALKVPEELLDSVLGKEPNNKSVEKKYPKPDFRHGRPPPRERHERRGNSQNSKSIFHLF